MPTKIKGGHAVAPPSDGKCGSVKRFQLDDFEMTDSTPQQGLTALRSPGGEDGRVRPPIRRFCLGLSHRILPQLQVTILLLSFKRD